MDKKNYIKEYGKIASKAIMSNEDLDLYDAIRELSDIKESPLSTDEDVEGIVNIIRDEAKKANKHIGILMDIAGPKIRVDLSNMNNREISITKNHIYSLGFSKMNDIPINIDVSFQKINELKKFEKNIF